MHPALHIQCCKRQCAPTHPLFRVPHATQYFKSKSTLPSTGYWHGVVANTSDASGGFMLADNSSVPQNYSVTPYAHWAWNYNTKRSAGGYSCVVARGSQAYDYFIGESSQLGLKAYYSSTSDNKFGWDLEVRGPVQPPSTCKQDCPDGWLAKQAALESPLQHRARPPVPPVPQVCDGAVYAYICEVPASWYPCMPPPSPSPPPPSPPDAPAPPAPPGCRECCCWSAQQPQCHRGAFLYGWPGQQFDASVPAPAEPPSNKTFVCDPYNKYCYSWQPSPATFRAAASSCSSKGGVLARWGPLQPVLLLPLASATPQAARVGCHRFKRRRLPTCSFTTALDQYFVENYFRTSGALVGDYWQAINRSDSAAPFQYFNGTQLSPNNSNAEPYVHWSWYHFSFRSNAG